MPPPDSVVLVVDVANVMGSRPDGWWRDRAGAATRLLESLVPLVDSVVALPTGSSVHLHWVHAVVEGQARAATVPEGIDVLSAPADGDSSIVAVAQGAVAGGHVPLVVTADRGLRARLPETAVPLGPSWLLALLNPV